MDRRLLPVSLAIATTALVAATVAPAGAHPMKKPARPTVGSWHTDTSVTYYALGKWKVSDHGKKVSHISFTPNDGVQFCTPGHYTVPGSFKIRPGGPKGYHFHIGQKVKGSKVWQVNHVAYTIGGKKQPTTTNLEIDFSKTEAYVEFGPYGTASCNVFFNMTRK